MDEARQEDLCAAVAHMMFPSVGSLGGRRVGEARGKLRLIFNVGINTNIRSGHFQIAEHYERLSFSSFCSSHKMSGTTSIMSRGCHHSTKETTKCKVIARMQTT